MLELIGPKTREQIQHYRSRFSNNSPFRFVVIDDFLAPDFCRQLARQFPAFDPERARNEFGEIGGKCVFQNLSELGPPYRRFDELVRSREFLELIGNITGIPDLLYDPEYVGGGTHDNRSGQELDPHVDFNYHPRTKWHRRLNLILFLNPEWEESWGGSLELHLNPWLPPEENEVQFVAPVNNRAVIFETSEISWHGFRKIQTPPDRPGISRRSLAVYFYTLERPAEEIFPEHATVYVQRPLPDHIGAGHRLTEEDLRQVRGLLLRRDQQLKFLYQRELRFSSAMGEQNQQIAEQNRQIEERNQHIGKQDRQIEEQNRRIEERNQHIAEQDRQIVALTGQLEAVARSPSLRLGRALTWPLRKILGR